MKAFLISLLITNVFAATGTIDSTQKYAWGENVGWINFGSSEGNVVVNDSELTGYAWGENVGWISLNCSNTSSCATVDFKVSNTTGGELSGYAWGENVGWINFSPGFGVNPRINTSGEFTGYAWGENVGWINFNCSNLATCATVSYKVLTSWRPASSGGGGGGTTGTSVSQTPATSPVTTSTPTSLPSTTVSPTIPPPTTTPLPSVQSTPIVPTNVPIVQSSTVAPISTGVTSGVPGASATPTISLPAEPPSGVLPSSSPSVEPSAASGAIDKITVALKPVIQVAKVVVEKGAQPISAATTLGVVVSTGASVTSLISSGINFFNFAQFLFNNFLVFFGIKKKTRAWGTVYNARTKQPLSFTKVQLLGPDLRVLETRITDREGRYGFLSTAAGSVSREDVLLKVSAIRQGFSFPSKIVVGENDTVLYDRVYHGETIRAHPQELIKYDIPMDPEEPEKIANSAVPNIAIHNILANISHVMFWIALVVVPLNYIMNPNVMNLIMLILFVGLNLLVLAGDLQQRAYGIVLYRDSGLPVPYSLITLQDASNQRKGFTVSDDRGRYFLLSEKGTYKISTFTPANVSPPRSAEESITAARGWIAKKLHL